MSSQLFSEPVYKMCHRKMKSPRSRIADRDKLDLKAGQHEFLRTGWSLNRICASEAVPKMLGNH